MQPLMEDFSSIGISRKEFLPAPGSRDRTPGASGLMSNNVPERQNRIAPRSYCFSAVNSAWPASVQGTL